MEMQKVVVKYRDESEATTYLTQYSLSQFAMYCSKNGIAFDMKTGGLMAITMLRYQAYSELFSDPKFPRPSFDKWDATVLEVNPVGEPETANPTQTEASES